MSIYLSGLATWNPPGVFNEASDPQMQSILSGLPERSSDLSPPALPPGISWNPPDTSNNLFQPTSSSLFRLLWTMEPGAPKILHSLYLYSCRIQPPPSYLQTRLCLAGANLQGKYQPFSWFTSISKSSFRSPITHPPLVNECPSLSSVHL